jgi:hypothetical protein
MAAAAAADCALFFCTVLLAVMRALNRTRAGLFMSYT